MNEPRTLRLAGWAGLAFSALSLIVVPLTAGATPPFLGADGAEFAEWYRAHRLGFLVGNWLGIAAFVPGFFQLAVLAVHFRTAANGLHAALVLATGTFTYAVFACSLVVFQVLPFVTREDAAETLGTMSVVWFSLDGLAALPFVLAVGAAAAATRALPAWFVQATWVTAVLVLAMSFGSLAERPAWLAAGGMLTLLGFVAFFAWTTALSIVMLRGIQPPR